MHFEVSSVRVMVEDLMLDFFRVTSSHCRKIGLSEVVESWNGYRYNSLQKLNSDSSTPALRCVLWGKREY